MILLDSRFHSTIDTKSSGIYGIRILQSGSFVYPRGTYTWSNKIYTYLTQSVFLGHWNDHHVSRSHDPSGRLIKFGQIDTLMNGNRYLIQILFNYTLKDISQLYWVEKKFKRLLLSIMNRNLNFLEKSKYNEIIERIVIKYI